MWVCVCGADADGIKIHKKKEREPKKYTHKMGCACSKKKLSQSEIKGKFYSRLTLVFVVLNQFYWNEWIE